MAAVKFMYKSRRALGPLSRLGLPARLSPSRAGLLNGNETIHGMKNKSFDSELWSHRGRPSGVSKEEEDEGCEIHYICISVLFHSRHY